MVSKTIKKIAKKIQQRSLSLSPPILKRSKRMNMLRRSSSIAKSLHKKMIKNLNRSHKRFFSRVRKRKSAQKKVNVLRKKLPKNNILNIQNMLY